MEKNPRDSENKAVHVAIVLVVFTLTGFTAAFLGRQIMEWLEIPRFSWQYWLLWIAGILPIYNVIILVYAAIFGKYRYFREKQKKMLRRIFPFGKK